MANLQLSAANISALLGGIGGQTVDAQAAGKVAVGGQFLALLDVVGGIAELNAGAQTVNNNKKDDGQDPVAGNAPPPVAFRDAPHPVEKSKKPSDEKTSGAAVNTRGDKPVEKAQTENSRQQDAADDKKPDARNVAQKPAQNDNKQADVADVAGADAPPAEEIAGKLVDKTDNLSGLLAIMAAFLAQLNAQNLPQNIPSENPVVTGANAAQNPAAVAGDLPATFADLKNTLSELQKFLQAAGSGDAPLTEAQNQQLSAINTQLADELSALKNLLPQATGDATAPAQNALPQIAEIAPLLQSDVAMVKEALQKFREKLSGGDNAPAKQDAPIFTASISSSANLAAITANQQGNQLNNAEKKPVENFVFSADGAANSSLISPNVLQANQQNNNTQQAIVAANFVQAGAGLENNAGGNAGQGGNQQQPQFNISSVSANSAQSASSKAAADFSSMVAKAAHTPIAEQVSFHIKNAAGNGNSKITIHLDPEELGKLDIELSVDSKGKAGITITADNKQTLDLLQRDSRGLEKALSDAGLKTDAGSLSFNLRGEQQNGGQGHNNSQMASSYRKSQPEEEIMPIAAVVRSYSVSVPDGLDISI